MTDLISNDQYEATVNALKVNAVAGFAYSTIHRYTFHAIGDNGFAACGNRRLRLLEETGLRITQVPQGRQCTRNGCVQRWNHD